MHRHDDSRRLALDLPIRARFGETLALDDGRSFDVAAAIAAIVAAPAAFEYSSIGLRSFADQIRGRTKLTFHYVAAMARADAHRPLLLGRSGDGPLVLLDGRHRAARMLPLGYETSQAWTMTGEQMEGFIGVRQR